MSDLTNPLNAYKYLLKLTEELLGYAGIPEELKKKYELIKEKTLEKVKHSSFLSDSSRTASTRYASESHLTDELSFFVDMIYTSTNTLCDKIVSLLNYLTNLTTRSGVPDSQRTVYGSGLIADNKSQFFSKLKSIRDLDSGKNFDAKNNIENFITDQVPRFEKLENRLLKYINGIEDHILRQNEKVLEMEEIIEQLQRNEQKLKVDMDILSSKVNDARQIQTIEKMERSQDFQSQILQLKDSSKKAELNYERQITQLKTYYEGIISDLHEKYQNAEQSFTNRLEDVLEKDKVKSQSLSELEYSQKFIETVKREFQLFYDKYISTHSKSFDSKQGNKKNKDKLYDLIYFIVHLLQKFENDNLWLVDKLTDLGNENEDLKTRIDTDRGAKEEFDKLFKKLRNELQDSKSAFFEWENSIQNLKKSVEDEKDMLKASDLA